MFRFCRRLLCFALALMMMAALFPDALRGGSAKADSSTYGIVTAEDVNFRIGPSMKERHLFRVAKGTVCPVLGTTTDSEGILWYQANAVNPETGAEFTGYLRGDCFRMLTDSEETAYRNGTLITPTNSNTTPVDNRSASEGDIVGYVQTIKGSVNVRASIGGTSLTQVGIYETFPYLVAPIQRGSYTWYFIQVNSYTRGYVRGDCVKVVKSPSSGNSGTVTPINNNTNYNYNNTNTTIDTTNPTGYLKTTMDDVNVRKGIWGDRIAIVKKAGTEFPFYGTPKVSGKTTWYFIKGDFGFAYIHGGYVTVTAQYTPAPTETNTGSVTPAPTPAPLTPTGYLKTKMDKVNVRDAIWGETIYVVQKAGTEFPYYGEPTTSGSTKWYRIKGDFGYAYIHGGYITVTATYTPTPTPEPTATSSGSVTPAPTPTPITPTGYLKTKMDKVNVRDAIWGETIYVVQKAGTEFPYYGEPTTSGSTKWYRIKGDFGYAYIHGGYITVTATYTPTPTPEPTATSSGSITPAPTPAPVQPSGYLKTKMDKVNVRDGIWGETIYVVQKAGTEFPYYGEPTTSGSTKWYRIKGDFGYAYIHGGYITVTASYTPTPTPAPTATSSGSITPTPTPAPQQPSGYVKTKMDKVNVRDGVWGETIYVVQKAGTEFPYYGEPTVSGSTKWYRIKGDFGYAYIHGNYVTVTASYTPTPTPSGAPGPSPTSYTPSGGANEASYTTLRYGSKGIAVENLVAELINQGFYSGSLTNNYTSLVMQAVKDFQKANGLAQDGIAGNDTQHALFHTVPIGQGDRSNLTMDLYPAEKINWYTGGIQELWPRGSNFKIYDVETKLVWWAHRWSGGKHVDAEPLTAADTAQLCKIYSLSHYGNTTTITNAQQIADNNLYQRRPSLVTIGTRTFACSVYGVPHNYPDGDTIKDNNYNGQLCIHFTGSKTHDSDKVDTLHTQAIEDAWTNAPNGHK